MSILEALLTPNRTVHAHCDLPCGVYDPAQARIEAESVKACQEKYQGSDDEIFKDRAVSIKEERADLVYATRIRVKNDGLLKIGMYGEVKF